ncbi:hypothetical protein [Rhodoferax saidenbachensis]|uniref:Cell envelope biogenesis protein TolA n=1 Tax=Rhodoferax saidenbachensis TaxID=1484693 RepID=A0A1P8KCL6_9BURK|nr:hypothetical protein [Rhodoferax saidenbachensis]APW43763.1 hypothetical protein RS694_15285 [Rhodoferax saidenbachensis]
MKNTVLTLIGSVIAAGAMAAPPAAPPAPSGGATPCAPPACKPITAEDRRKEAKAAEIMAKTKGNKTAEKDKQTMAKAKEKAEAPKKP